MNEENQVYFVDSDTLPPAALERKHRLEQDPSFRTNHMEYMKGMEIIQSDIKDKVLKAMDEFDYDAYTAADVERALSHETCSVEDFKALIRTLALDPELLLLDEPFSALDYQTRLTVCDDVRQIIRQEKKTAILVTHDLSEAISMADRVLVLSKRPATIHLDLPTIFEDQTLSPMNRRQAPEFQGYFNQIWKELNHHE